MRISARRLSIGLGVALLAGALFVLSAWMVASKLIEPVNHAVPMPPGLEAQVVSIPGAGHAIAAWWMDAGGESAVVLLLHGMGADRSSMVSRAQLLRRHGFSVLLIDLQAEGETPGSAITFGARESADVVAARQWLDTRAPSRRVGVVGCSLGGASVLLAPQPARFDAVVLEAVYPRISRAVENRVRLRLGYLAPVLSPLLLMQLKPRLGFAQSELEPIRYIGRLSAPVLIVAGSADEHTTLEESEELFAAAANPKGLWVVPSARHQDFLAYRPAEYEAHVVSFPTRTLALPPSTLQKMDQAEVRHWLDEKSSASATPHFEPFNGTIPCCDRPYPALRFLPGQIAEIVVAGFAAERRAVHYIIREDGLIALQAADPGMNAWLQAKDLQDMFLYQYGADTYLVQESETAPDFFFERPNPVWPLKFFAD